MGIWIAPAKVETPQRLIIFKRPYKHEDGIKPRSKGLRCTRQPYGDTLKRVGGGDW